MADSHHDGQHQAGTHTKAMEGSAGARGAWLPSGFGKALLYGRGPQAGALRAGARALPGGPPSVPTRGRRCSRLTQSGSRLPPPLRTRSRPATLYAAARPEDASGADETRDQTLVLPVFGQVAIALQPGERVRFLQRAFQAGAEESGADETRDQTAPAGDYSAAASPAIECRSPSVRDMLPNENSAVADLRVATFASHLSSPYNIYLQRRKFEEALANKAAVLVAVTAGPQVEIVGCADLLLSREAPTPACYVTNVGVHPRARRCGIARALMREVERRAAKLGVREVVLHVDVSNKAAQAFYDSMDYVDLAEDRQIAFYSQEPFADDTCPPQRLLHKKLTLHAPEDTVGAARQTD